MWAIIQRAQIRRANHTIFAALFLSISHDCIGRDPKKPFASVFTHKCLLVAQWAAHLGCWWVLYEHSTTSRTRAHKNLDWPYQNLMAPGCLISPKPLQNLFLSPNGTRNLSILCCCSWRCTSPDLITGSKFPHANIPWMNPSNCETPQEVDFMSDQTAKHFQTCPCLFNILINTPPEPRVLFLTYFTPLRMG